MNTDTDTDTLRRRKIHQWRRYKNQLTLAFYGSLRPSLLPFLLSLSTPVIVPLFICCTIFNLRVVGTERSNTVLWPCSVGVVILLLTTSSRRCRCCHILNTPALLVIGPPGGLALLHWSIRIQSRRTKNTPQHPSVQR